MAGFARTGKTSSIPGGLAVGAVVSVVMTMALTALWAWLLDREMISWENVGYGVLITIMLSAFAGAVAAFGKIRRQRLLICMMSGTVYFGLLLSITALFFGGRYEAVGVTAILVFGGCFIASLTGTGPKRGGGKHGINYLRKKR